MLLVLLLLIKRGLAASMGAGVSTCAGYCRCVEVKPSRCSSNFTSSLSSRNPSAAAAE